jgi:3',5'-cyclic AMP phosphodiesterase CpdA
LAHLSDIHFGAVDHCALEALAEFVREDRPDAIIVAGDLTQNGRRREFVAAREWLDSLEIPWIAAPGNHDTPALHLPLQAPSRMLAPFRRYARYVGDNDAVGKLVELGGGRVRLSAINSARGVQGRINWADGVINLGDLEATLQQLAGGPAHAWRILVCHHPLREPAHSQISVDTKRGGRALRRCAAAHVDVILTGHIHDAFAHAIDGPRRHMVQMGSGTLSTRLRGTHPGFCVVTLAEDHVRQEVASVTPDGVHLHLNYDSRIHQPGMLLQHPKRRA